MIKLKACPKCHGDLYLEKDQYGRFLSCLQCGYLTELLGELLSELPGKQPGELPAVSQSGKPGQSRRTPAEAEQLAA